MRMSCYNGLYADITDKITAKRLMSTKNSVVD